MSIITDWELAEEQAAAESRMLDTWEIGIDGGWSYNSATGKDEQTLTDSFTTKGRIKQVSAFGNREGQGGGRTVIETRRELHIPVSSPDAPVNAIAVCTAVHATSDPTLLGARVRLGGPAPGSQTTARRLEVIEVLT